jgi:hypothetical protein
MRHLNSSLARTRSALALAASLFPGLFTQTQAQVSETEMRQLESKLPPASGTPVEFNRDIRPIFENSCIRCHGVERPKGGFELTSREAALKGGDHGADIVPGQSAQSPLIYYVARLVEDMEMPPAGKGDPLTSEQVGLLRAWIDQGANWEESANRPPRLQFSVTPTIQWFAVDGNEQKFREHTGVKDGWTGGAQSIFLREQLAPGRTLTFEGRALLNPEEYRFRLSIDQKDLGFVRMGFEQYRDYYSDTGGYDPAFTPPSYSLDRDLHLDIGRAWARVGLTLPDWPQLILGYELQYRDGSKSLLQWGDVGTINPSDDIVGTDAKKIYPSAKEIHERVHIVRFDLTHEVQGIGIENNFAAEFYENSTSRQSPDFFNANTFTLEKSVLTEERQEHFQASDAFRLEKQVLDWLFLSGGYYYSRLEGDYSFNNQTISPVGSFGTSDPYWFTDSIVLEQDTHIFNANTQLGPWDGLTLFGGVQSEWMSQRGFGNVRLDEGIPGAIVPEPATVDSDLDRSVIEEHAGLRYTKIPYTVLFAEGRLAQESVGQYENHIGGGHEFLRDTDASSDLYDGRLGLTISPWTRVSLTAQYKHRLKDADYDHTRDEQFGVRNEGYSAFITSRETETDEISLKLTLRPASWLKTSLTYQKVATDYTTGTDPYILPELVIPGLPPFPAQVLSPGGVTFAGEYDANIYGLLLNVTPWHRLSLSSTFTYRNSETTTSHNLSPVLVNYQGDVYSSLSTATFILNPKTDLFGSYNYSWADYGQDNFSAGLPLGLVYDWHVATAGISRKWRDNITTTLQYRFYHYDEGNTGGANNYTAHGVLAALSMSLN